MSATLDCFNYQKLANDVQLLSKNKLVKTERAASLPAPSHFVL